MTDRSGPSAAPRDRPDPTLRQPAPKAARWAEQSLGQWASIVGSQRLVGGLTADMFRLAVRSGAGPDRDVVLRCWPVDAGWGPECVRREATGLAAIAESGLPVPRMLAHDVTGGQAGSPATLTTLVPGEVDLAPADFAAWLRGQALMLARIHRLPMADLLPAEQDYDIADLDLSWLEDSGLAAEPARAAEAPAQQRGVCHGDYQHFNLLWSDGRISGVVDWPKMGIGDRGLDVGHCRLNLAVLFSTEAAETFRDHYERAAGSRVDPAADVRALLGFHPGWAHFIPRQVAGRTTVDGPGMAGRVGRLLALALTR